MIVRIVHMHFAPENTEAFLALFDAHRAAIAAQPGCHSLQLVRGLNHRECISTISQWDSQTHLDAYRHSALFGEVWPATKALFSAPPQAESHELLWAS
jgi:quinol monooxygenase YgiN